MENLEKNNFNKFDKITNSDNLEDSFYEIKKISVLFDNLFEKNHSNNLDKVIDMSYNFKKEFSNGSIEYKRSLISYNNSDKINKLIRQIYWRIYEGVVTENVQLCYYIIGLEDSGIASTISSDELIKSLNIINNAIYDTYIQSSHLFMKNTYNNSIILVIKLWIEKENKIEYF